MRFYIRNGENENILLEYNFSIFQKKIIEQLNCSFSLLNGKLAWWSFWKYHPFLQELISYVCYQSIWRFCWFVLQQIPNFSSIFSFKNLHLKFLFLAVTFLELWKRYSAEMTHRWESLVDIRADLTINVFFFVFVFTPLNGHL